MYVHVWYLMLKRTKYYSRTKDSLDSDKQSNLLHVGDVNMYMHDSCIDMAIGMSE